MPEGYVVQRRLGMPLELDDIIDGVLAIFYRFTTPAGQPTRWPAQRLEDEMPGTDGDE